MSVIGMFQQLTMHAPVQPSLFPVGVRAEAAKRGGGGIRPSKATALAG
jgi:hypothetical protein